MTKARDIADFKFENIVDTGTEGTRVASGTTAQRGSTQGQFRFNSTTGLAEYYDGANFKSIDAPPSVTSVDVTEVDSQAGGNQTFVITGTSFSSGATVTFVGAAGTDFNASSATRDSTTQITAVAPKSSFLNAQEPYGIKVVNSSGLSASLAGQINVDSAPTFNINAGTLSTLADFGRAASNITTITATDADGDAITFSKISGTLPTGITFNSNGTFSGTANAETSDTTYTFTIRATANSKTADRQYSIIVKAPLVTGMQSVDTSVSGYHIYAFTNSGGNMTATFASNITADVLLVAGGGAGGYSYGNNDMGKGGGGAGQVLFKTGHSISAGSYTFYVADGGAGRTHGSNTQPNPSTPDGENTTAFGLTAIGGGNGGEGDSWHQAGQGGSGGGQGARHNNANVAITSNKTTPAGWNSYGNSGGVSANGNYSGGGGGGAGGVGGNQSGGTNDSNSLGGVGGVGIDLSSTFGTNFGENGYFAGGGAGGTYRGAHNSTITMANSQGGNGGGGDGAASTDRNSGNVYQFIASNLDGQANTGGGGGGSAEDHDGSTNIGSTGSASGAGGSGVILIRVAA